jgi:hypothetical protein
MLARRGWRVCVHAPGSVSPPSLAALDEDGEAEESEADREHMRRVQGRVRAWGVEEVVFDDGGCAADAAREGGAGDGGRGAAVRAVERLIADGDEFDAVVDTVGGKEVWEAGERLLAQCGSGTGGRTRRKQFTTTVGDCPARPVPTAKDNFRAGLRALKGNAASTSNGTSKKEKENNKNKKGASAVSYAWVSVAQDVDWEGEDVRDSLGAVVSMALEEGIRPVVEGASLPFERAGEVFEERRPNGASLGAGVLRGGSVVVRVVS